MADRWYCAHGGQRKGPFSSQQLKALADAGKILPTDIVWKEGIEKGAPASKVKNLFSPSAVNTTGASTAPAPRSPASSSPAAAATQAEDRPPDGTQDEPLAEADGADGGDAAAPAQTDEPRTTEGAVSDSNESTVLITEAPPRSLEEAPPTRAPRANPEPPKKGRAVAVKGAVVVGSDGVNVKFRKKCTECGFVDTNCTSLKVRPGAMRTTFFCRKCKKSREVELHGFTH